MFQHLLVWSMVTASSLCNMLQLLWVDLQTTYLSSAWQFHILHLEEVECNFWPSSLLPSGIFNQTCELCTWVFNFLFNTFIKDSHKTVKLKWISTKHVSIYFWRRLLIHKLHIISATLTSLFLLRLFHATYYDQYHIWYHCLFTMHCFCGGVKMTVLYFWAEIFEQDLFCHLITDY